MSKEANDNVHELLTKYLAGNSSEEENQVIINWRAEDPQNERIFLEFEKTWKLTGDFQGDTIRDINVDLDKEWDILRAKISQNDDARVIDLQPKLHIQKQFPLIQRIAAVFILAIVSSVIIFYFLRETDQVYYAEKPGFEVPLADGSIVTLNQYSELVHSKDFSEKRHVKLDGEAFFEIVPDTNKPFVVNLGNTQVTVLGTSFNVRSFGGENEVEVVVASGRVKVSTKNNEQGIELAPGNKAIVSRSSGQITQSQNDDVNFLAWKTRELNFSDVELHEVVSTINRVYFTNIEIASEEIQKCRIAVTFNNESLSAMLRILVATLDIQIETEEDKIIITGSGC